MTSDQNITVGHAIALMRAGCDINLRLDDKICRVRPVDLLGDDTLDWRGEEDVLVITGVRARSIGIATSAETVCLPLKSAMSTTALRAFGDPLLTPLNTRRLSSRDGGRIHSAAIQLCKLAGLLPSAILADGGNPAHATVSVADIENYRREEALSLTPMSAARVPLAMIDHVVRIVPFRPSDGRMEHLAILVGEPELHEAPLTRIHSECFTGDLLGSLRCDCGEQLKGALKRMADDGAGVLLYLAQEGRGIGLANKLRAYQLQDRGLDTVEANQHLGFEADERDFLSAAMMLRHLDIHRVRLMSNNPEKIKGLSENGIDVAERVAHEFEANAHNREYLLTKKAKSGHLLEIEDVKKPTGTGD